MRKTQSIYVLQLSKGINLSQQDPLPHNPSRNSSSLSIIKVGCNKKTNSLFTNWRLNLVFVNKGSECFWKFKRIHLYLLTFVFNHQLGPWSYQSWSDSDSFSFPNLNIDDSTYNILNYFRVLMKWQSSLPFKRIVKVFCAKWLNLRFGLFFGMKVVSLWRL